MVIRTIEYMFYDHNYYAKRILKIQHIMYYGYMLYHHNNHENIQYDDNQASNTSYIMMTKDLILAI